MDHLVLYAIPGFVALMIIEALWVRRARRDDAALRGYAVRDTATSLTLGIGNVVLHAATNAATFGLLVVAYEHRLFTLPSTWWTWALLLVAEDLCYYAFHRSHHEVRALWAAHINHHSSTHYNLSTALRQSWTTPFTSPWFWLPLPFLGFAPWMIITQKAISLLYQFWLHTESIRSLGPLELVLNTPSHHRVHHGRNDEYLDRNHGGILIVWDRLFGTFEPERTRPDYGLTTNLTTHHPVRAAFHEWVAIGRDLRRARSLRDALGYLVGPPGWQPGDRSQTSKARRAARARSEPGAIAGLPSSPA
jgi:sterol desaturase/sphingolipid hydroxylase (fatty acid hydroxylase superfamily)